MKLRTDIERTIYATSYAIRLRASIDLGYPQAWRVADAASGIPPGSADRLEEWERWCADLAIEAGEVAVDLYRAAKKRQRE